MGRATDGTALLAEDGAKDAAGMSAVSGASDDADVSLGSGNDPEQGAPDDSARATAPRTILVDGFNVLHAVLLGRDRENGWWRRKHRERLLERLCDWRGGPDQIWVAFDGTRPAESIWAEPVAIVVPSPIAELPREAEPKDRSADALDAPTTGPAGGAMQAPTIHTVFVESADDWIVRRARKAQDPGRLIVVSADRKVAGRARSAGCEILTPWTFMAGCGPAPEDDRPGSA